MKKAKLDTGLNNYTESNRKLWNDWTRIHEKSDFYNLQEFKSSRNSLKQIEIEEVGEVTGKSMLHLQCHFGLDSLSWAVKGAHVTAVDYSNEAILLAKSLSQDLQIPAHFICSDVYDLPDSLDQKFDIVFTSYGVLNWLNDLNKWAKLIAHHLKPDGFLYMIEFHPLAGMLNDDGEFEYGYFFHSQPERFFQQGTYANPDADFSRESYEWAHGMGEIVTALIKSGLKIEYLLVA